MKRWTIAFVVVFLFCGLTWAGDGAAESMEMVFAKKYLNMPVKHEATNRTMDILIDGKIVRQFVIELAEGEPDYWVFLDVSEFEGKKATLKLDAAEGKSNLLEKIYQDDSIREAETFYKEKNRQQFHFSSRRGWNNDANGMMYYDGEYHLFYQHNPYGWKWGNMTWGHAVSTDMVHWKELSDAIHPDHLGTIFSGSAVVDKKNTAGFQTGDEKVLVCIYTSATGTKEFKPDNAWSKGRRFTQSIAYSNDRGRTWTVYEGNPVIEHINLHNRDPKVIWHEPTQRWVMALFLGHIRGRKSMAFFSSPDLKNWTKNSELYGFNECPELFELPVDSDKNNTRWVFFGGSGDYFVGQFDGKEFKPDGEAIRFQSGNCFYASQTFNNMPKEDGRRIQIAWGRIATPGMPFNQCMLFPVELTLHTTEDGIRMFAKPIREISTLYKKKHSWRRRTIKPGKNLLRNIKGELFHMKADFSVADADEFGFVIRGLPVTYNATENLIVCKNKKAELKPVDGKIGLEILVDRNSVEIFANNGSMYMPIGQILPEDNKSIELFTKSGKTQVENIEVYELNSAWK